MKALVMGWRHSATIPHRPIDIDIATSRSIVTIEDTARGGNVGRRAGTACICLLEIVFAIAAAFQLGGPAI
jgi:hypothetical protein